jgi:hypothetical protein
MTYQEVTSKIPNSGPLVYFIKISRGVIKIGFTTNLKQRLNAFKTSSLIDDSDVLLAIPDNRD